LLASWAFSLGNYVGAQRTLAFRANDLASQREVVFAARGDFVGATIVYLLANGIEDFRRDDGLVATRTGCCAIGELAQIHWIAQ